MKRILAAAVMAILFLAAAPARAQFPGNVPDTFRLQLGGEYGFFDTTLTFQQDINGGGPVGPEVSLEDVLGLPSSKAGFVGTGYWNFAGRSYIDFGYYTFSRTHSETVTSDVVLGDNTYTIGSTVSTKMKSDFPFISYRYGFVKSETAQFGASLGVAWVNLTTELSASAGVIGPGGPIIGTTVTRTAKASTPVPLLGLTWEGQIADNLSVGARVEGIFATVNPYSGYMISGTAHIDWYFAQNFGLGGGYSYSKFSIKRDDLPNLLVDYSYRVQGPRAYLILTF